MTPFEFDGKWYELTFVTPANEQSSVECCELSNPDGVFFDVLWDEADGLKVRQIDGPAPASGLVEIVKQNAIEFLGDTLIDFYDGAYGPTILMKCLRVDAIRRLRDAMVLVRDTGDPVDLGDLPHVMFVNFEGLHLSRSDQPRRPVLTKAKDSPNFHWCCTAEEWETTVQMLDPLLDGGPGHQYLTEEGSDAALIEVSIGERGVGTKLVEEM